MNSASDLRVDNAACFCGSQVANLFFVRRPHGDVQVCWKCNTPSELLPGTKASAIPTSLVPFASIIEFENQLNQTNLPEQLHDHISLINSLSPSAWVENRVQMVAKGLALLRCYYRQRAVLYMQGQYNPESIPVSVFTSPVLKADIAAYEPMHPELLVFTPEWCSEELNGTTNGGHYMPLPLRAEAPTVSSIPVFSTAYCQLLLEEMLHAKNSLLYVPLNFKGLYLDQFGFRPFMEQFTALLNKSLLDRGRRVTLVYDTCSIVYYDQESAERGHPPHLDNSDLTLNVCIGAEGFTGCELLLSVPQAAAKNTLHTAQTTAERHHYHAAQASQLSLPTSAPDFGSEHPPEPLMDQIHAQMLEGVVTYEYKQQIGRGLFHPGAIVHAARSLTSGTRLSLVVWWKAYYEFALFTKLPIEIQTLIVSYLGLDDIGHFAQCSKHTNTLTQSPVLWQLLFQATFNGDTSDNCPIPRPTDTKSVPKRRRRPEHEFQNEAPKRNPVPYLSTAADNTDKNVSMSWRYRYYTALQRQLDLVCNYNYEAERDYPPTTKMAPTHLTRRTMPSTATFLPTLQRQQSQARAASCYLQ
eukprot:TRINITY_DN3884_c0_g1_i2.p1 TRINITY_DN3884_c0_g1~~TRINITY_DN3884_c0_g1_i2.p1  ORF type:complete len:614 (+),score=60.20 TRINITY_DN3884_c0_g1_i2:98-1843(+)